MKNQIQLLAVAAAAAMFTACSNDDLLVPQNVEQAQVQAGSVGFDAYLQRTKTRAGYIGEIQLDQLKETGFGVFAYYTDNNDYEPLSQPNFMYNQKVTFNDRTSKWVYEPVKYWPNEYGSDATSDDADKVSFFAYAPFVSFVPSTGKLDGTADDAKYGIAGVTRNSATGDPIVKYIASFDQDKSVDLIWGTVPADNTTWNIIQGAATQTLEAGLPWLNIQRPREAATQEAAQQRVKFQFEHALSQLSVNIDADVDGLDETNPLDANTRIWVRSITFNGFSLKGALNLNNTEAGAGKAYWLDYGGVADLVTGDAVTVFDGLKDGKEGTAGAEARNEKILGFNPQLIQSDADIENGAWKADRMGVTNERVSLFRKLDAASGAYTASDAPVMVIPNGDDVTVEIVYDVETIDPNLANYVSDCRTKGTSIENRISKTVSFGGVSVMENGKHYTLNLHLGMNSVKLDADVTGWVDVEEKVVEVPSNQASFTGGARDLGSVPASTTSYTFSVDGLDRTSTYSVEVVSGNVTSISPATISNVNVATISLAIPENTQTTANPITIAVTDGTETLTLTLTQQGIVYTEMADAVVGDFITSAGHAFESREAAATAGETAVAIVAYKNATAGSSLALALEDATTTNQVNRSNAAQFAEGYSGGVCPEGYEWALPTQAQWDNMISSFDNRAAFRTATGLRSDYYWSSTVLSLIESPFNSGQQRINLRNGNWNGVATNIGGNAYVRAAFAF